MSARHPPVAAEVVLQNVHNTVPPAVESAPPAPPTAPRKPPPEVPVTVAAAATTAPVQPAPTLKIAVPASGAGAEPVTTADAGAAGGASASKPAAKKSSKQSTVATDGSSSPRDKLLPTGFTPAAGRWTKEEDEKLRAAITLHGPQNWKRISHMMANGETGEWCVACFACFACFALVPSSHRLLLARSR